MNYVLLAGLRGYLPSYVEECTNFGTALDVARVEYELAPDQVLELGDAGVLLLGTCGSEYLEIQEAEESWNQVYHIP